MYNSGDVYVLSYFRYVLQSARRQAIFSGSGVIFRLARSLSGMRRAHLPGEIL